MKQSWKNTLSLHSPYSLPPASLLIPPFIIIMFITVFCIVEQKQEKKRKANGKHGVFSLFFFFGISVWVRLKARLFWQIVSHNLWRVLFLHIAKNNKQNPLLLLLLLQMPHLIYGRSRECAAIGFYFISFHILLLFIDSFCCWPARLM